MKKVLFLFILLVGLVLAACGGGQEGSDGGSSDSSGESGNESSETSEGGRRFNGHVRIHI
ncbi:ABC-type glycerol-3-phosphate transport system substrate-binding protein [Alkalibacillus flavidus]|uniref:ABC-type glycerol-3-phosphate transport system substrate-binding protein n=1 Tax=Alkalibacillus flavidus TaxID=546021 RepID=A0ABV2KT71_9BACI